MMSQKYVLPSMSNEQREIISFIKKQNVYCNACPGAGKSTTIFGMIDRYPDEKILVLTYNSRLKIESRQKCAELGFRDRSEIHSYHSFGWRYYTQLCKTDEGINHVLDTNMQMTKHPWMKYSIIVIDEAQDMTLPLYKFVVKIMKDMNFSGRICVLGDKRQAIFNFQGSDSRFLTYAHKIFDHVNSHEWLCLKLSTSYRLTNQMCNFVNYITGEKTAIHNKVSQNKVLYFRKNLFHPKTISYLARMVKNLVKEYGINEIFILGPSVKQGRKRTSPIRALSNKLSDKGYSVYATKSNHERLDERIINDKIVLTNFHSIKGLERKVIIVFGFDASYYKYYNRNVSEANQLNIQPALFVAITRGLEKLIILHNASSMFLPFIRKSDIKQIVNYVDDSDNDEDDEIQYIRPQEKIRTSYGVTDLISHITSETLLKINSCIETKKIRLYNFEIDIPDIISTGLTTCEYVSELNGTALPMYYEYITKGYQHMYEKYVDMIRGIEKGKKYDDSAYKIQFTKSLKPFPKRLTSRFNIIPFLRFINVYEYCTSGYNFKINQIKRYNWITQQHLNLSSKRLKKMFNSNSTIPKRNDTIEFETTIEMLFDHNGDVYTGNIALPHIHIGGRIDAIDHVNKCVYELKCTNEIKLEHRVQTALYMFIFGKMDYRYFVYNIKTDEQIELICKDYDILQEYVKSIIVEKLNNKGTEKDVIFLEKVYKARERVLNNDEDEIMPLFDDFIDGSKETMIQRSPSSPIEYDSDEEPLFDL